MATEPTDALTLKKIKTYCLGCGLFCLVVSGGIVAQASLLADFGNRTICLNGTLSVSRGRCVKELMVGPELTKWLRLSKLLLALSLVIVGALFGLLHYTLEEGKSFLRNSDKLLELTERYFEQRRGTLDVAHDAGR